jgi:hypothetical protein
MALKAITFQLLFMVMQLVLIYQQAWHENHLCHNEQRGNSLVHLTVLFHRHDRIGNDESIPGLPKNLIHCDRQTDFYQWGHR